MTIPILDFSSQQYYDLGNLASTYEIIVDDFNGDQFPDILTPHSSKYDLFDNKLSDPQVNILVNKGDGTFETAKSFPLGDGLERIFDDGVRYIGNSPISTIVTDLNGNGQLDIISGNNVISMNQVTVLLDNDNATFQAPRYFLSGPLDSYYSTNSLVAEDFDADGDVDIIASSTSSGSNSGNISLLSNDGQGNLTYQKTLTDIPVGNGNPGNLQLGDVNGDGKKDLVFRQTVFDYEAWSVKSSQILWMPNQGGGNFGNPATVSSILSPTGFDQLLVKDINSDGTSEIIISTYNNYSNLDNLSVFFGNNTGSFTEKLYPSQLESPFQSIDIDEDGDIDIVGSKQFIANQGDGSFLEPVDLSQDIANVYFPEPNIIKDLNQDGKLDIVGVNSTTVTVALNNIVVDTLPPVANSFIPADNAITLNKDANLIVLFNDDIQRGTGSINLKKLSDNTVISTNILVIGNQLIIDPIIDLADNTAYYVEIANNAIQDMANNNYAGITGNSIWNFQTLPGQPTTILGTEGTDLIIGTENADTIDGLAGNDSISGLAGNDSLIGGAGDDSINGGAGDDTMVGGVGNDTYIVASTNDKVVEALNAGQDLINSSVTYTLPTNVENLTLTGTGNIKGTGNTLNNRITGNAGKNNLSGGTGADTLIGGAGDDTYTVDNTGDKITENASAGKDLIRSSVTYTLPTNVENLTLTGTGNIKVTGNTLNNRITGNAGKNNLSGGTGADTLIGGAGDDTYTLDNTGDKVTEKASAGKDLINSSVTYTLPTNVENLTLTGTGNINGTGNGAGNRITGNAGKNSLSGAGGIDTLNGGAGDDTLNGGVGNDNLTGGIGADRFLYATNAAFTTSSVGVDTITDFIISQNDKIVLDKTTFPKITSSNGTGFSINAEFAKVASNTAAATSGADIVYNTATGELFYNQNGTASGFGTGGGKFAILTNKPNLTENQFIIQA